MFISIRFSDGKEVVVKREQVNMQSTKKGCSVVIRELLGHGNINSIDESEYDRIKTLLLTGDKY